MSGQNSNRTEKLLDQSEEEEEEQGFIIRIDKRTMWVGPPPLHPSGTRDG